MKYIKIILIVIAIILTLVQCNKNNDPTPNSSPTDLFNTVWNDFDRNYPYFIHKKIDWDSVYQVYYPKVSDGMKSAELADVMGEMTLVLKDIHVNFNTSNTYYQYSKREFYPENPPSNAINYLSNIFVNNSIAIYGDISNSNFAYLRLKTFNGLSGSFNQVVSQLDSLIKRDGFIIDIRNNGGGNELNGRTIAGKFVQKETLYKYVRIRDGEDWNDFSNWQAADLDYALIEDNGIAPTHYILMDSNSIGQKKDLILEKAIELLHQQKSQPREGLAFDG